MSKEFDGNVKKIQKENLTPYKIATVILIREYCNETTKGNPSMSILLSILILNDIFLLLKREIYFITSGTYS